MEETKHKSINFYRNLGKLFYAIAACDGVVKDLEIEKLKELIKSEWLGIDNNCLTNTAHQIEFIFDSLNNKENLSSEACFNDFIQYKNDQKQDFTTPINDLILKTAGAIASSFSKKNKSELIMLARLDIELKKLNNKKNGK